MIQQENDAHLKKVIDHLEGLPENAVWNVNYGWLEYRNRHLRKKSLVLIFGLIAAAMVLFAVLLTTILFRNKSAPENHVIVSTGSQEKKQVELLNGSRIWLNSSTSIITDTELKQISLQGEAWFELSDEDTFTIITPHGKFITTNSSFNLKSKTGVLEAICTVAKGEVTITWENKPDQFTTAQSATEATIIPGIAIIMAPSKDPNYLAWKTGELHFSNTPLYCVAEKLEELNNSTIEIVNKDLRYCLVNYNFKTLSVQTILEELTSQIDLNIINKENIYRISGKGCTM